MAGKSAIEWTGHTWNPLAGCSVLTPGCKRCYAMKLAKRLGAMGNPLYAGLTKDSNAGAVWTGEMRKAPRHTLLEPLRRKKPTTYFVNSMSDLFHENAPDEWLDEIFAVMALCPQHTFQVLTKRAERMRSYMTARARMGELIWSAADFVACQEQTSEWHPSAEYLLRGKAVAPWPLPNVWLGVSTERQQEANERIPLLLQTPAAVRFISAEPLLGALDISDYLVETACTNWPNYLDWVIVGGESGNGARYMEPQWAADLRDQCKAGRTSFFLKQMTGKKPIPEDLMVRQFPR